MMKNHGLTVATGCAGPDETRRSRPETHPPARLMYSITDTVSLT